MVQFLLSDVIRGISRHAVQGATGVLIFITVGALFLGLVFLVIYIVSVARKRWYKGTGNWVVGSRIEVDGVDVTNDPGFWQDTGSLDQQDTSKD